MIFVFKSFPSDNVHVSISAHLNQINSPFCRQIPPHRLSVASRKIFARNIFSPICIQTMVFLVSFQQFSLFTFDANISPELHPLQRRCLPRNLLKRFRHKSQNGGERNICSFELLINMWIFHPRGVFHHQFVWGD